MLERKTFIFCKEWWECVRTMPDEMRLDAFDKICKYVFCGEAIPQDYTQPVNIALQFIVKDIDKFKSKYEDTCKARSEAGKKHKGNQYSKRNKVEQNGTHGTLVPKSEKTEEKITITNSDTDSYGTNETNGTNVPSVPKNGTNGTNGTDNENEYHNLSLKESSTSSSESACEKIETESNVENERKARIREWILDSEESTLILLRRLQLISERVPQETAAAILEPYINEFYENLMISGRDNPEIAGRLEVKSHFANWIVKYMRLKQNESNDGNTTRKSTSARAGTRNGNGCIISPEDFAKSFAAGFNAGAAKREQ